MSRSVPAESSSRNSRPLWPVLTAALIGLPVLYIASVGPAFGLLVRNMSEPMILTFNVVYDPLWFVLDGFPDWVKKAVENYARWFS
jgi:hypothetical protein